MTRKERKAVSEQLRAAIRGSGLSDYELAKRSGVAASAVSRFIKRERGLTTDSLDRLCKVLNLSLTKGPKE